MALEGIYCPITTPFIDERLASDKIAFNLERLNTTGLAGYVLLGSTGEPVHLTREEKIDTIRAARAHTPADKKLIIGSGLEATVTTLEFTRIAADCGADMVLVLSPHYYKGDVTPTGFVRHYSAVAEASPVPVLIYNVPRFTGVELPVDCLGELSRHENVIGLKESTANLSRLLDVTARCSENLSVLVGNARLFLSGLIGGAHGGVLAMCNVVPALCVKIFELSREGQFGAAQREMTNMIRILEAGIAQHGIPAIKAAMDLLGFYGGPPRSPLLPSSLAVLNSLKRELEAANLI